MVLPSHLIQHLLSCPPMRITKHHLRMTRQRWFKYSGLPNICPSFFGADTHSGIHIAKKPDVRLNVRVRRPVITLSSDEDYFDRSATDFAAASTFEPATTFFSASTALSFKARSLLPLALYLALYAAPTRKYTSLLPSSEV